MSKKDSDQDLVKLETILPAFTIVSPTFDEPPVVASSDAHSLATDIESSQHAESYSQFLMRAIPAITIRDPKSFAIYGNAQLYYENSFAYIYNSYPYDGSNYERIQWALSASAIDLAILQREYPMATGSANFSSNGWGTVSATAGNYALSTTPEYIKFSGGPYVGTVLDSDSGRESSLKIDPTTGNTIEFWMKKSAYPNTKTKREVIVDIYTDTEGESSNSYGRMQIAMDSQIKQAFSVTYLSGSKGMLNSPIGSDIIIKDHEIDGNWHHYAFSFGVRDSNLNCDLYMDGVHKERIATPTAEFGEFTAVNSHFKGTIGALGMDIGVSGASIGYGQLSASLDEVRIWKKARNSAEINKYYDRSVTGATDFDPADSILGLYYKFNESITSQTAADAVVLDYSGRLNNGTIVGLRGTTRSSDSAITNALSTANREIGDPIINSESPRVKSKLLDLVQIAKAHDKYNNSSLFKTVPQWAFDTPAGSSNMESNFSILLQAIASKFDDIRLLITGLTDIPLTTYHQNFYEASSDNYRANFSSVLGAPQDFINNYDTLSSKIFSFQNLASRGWNVGELPIVNKVNNAEYFHNLGTTEHDAKVAGIPKLIYSKAEIVKEQILSSVYNNLSNLYTTKGSHQAFRNLIRCFGVDENLVIPNTYINNIEKEITNEPVFDVLKVKSLAFTGSSTGVVLYQSASSDASEKNYINGKTDSTSFTIEGNFIFPKIEYTSNTALTASVFGLNQVIDSDLFLSSPNHAGISVKTVKTAVDKGSAYFSLSSSTGLFEETNSAYFQSVYDDTPWHIAVRLSENTGMPLGDYDHNISNDYKIEFLGHRYDLDVLTSNFHLSQSLTKTQYDNFMTGKKSVYAGAQRTNITGALLVLSDVKVVNLTVWDDYLENEELREHAKGIENLGRLYSFHSHKDNRGSNRNKADSLTLDWNFEDSTYANSKVSIIDASSGSLGNVKNFGPIVGYKYPATTSTISTGLTIIDQEHLTSVKYIPIDNMQSRSKIEIKDREIEAFQLDSRPVTYLYTYEKSMYQVISREMLKMLAGVREFNNIIGEPIYKYRQKYKILEKFRERFFSRIESDIDLDKFVEYYKWIDSSLGKMLENLQPATAAMKLGLEDVVESHAFERNKYQHQAPVFEFKDPKIEGNLLGINELLYDWKHGHSPYPSTKSNSNSKAGADISLAGDTLANLHGASFTIISTDGTSRTYTFDKNASPDGTGPTVKISGLDWNKVAIAAELVLAINHSGGHDGRILASSDGDSVEPTIHLKQEIPGTAGHTIVTKSDPLAGGLAIQSQFSGGSNSKPANEEQNCLWWNDRAGRTEILQGHTSTTTDSDREILRTRRNTIVSGSTYIIRKLTRPYRLDIDRLRVIEQGSNRNSNKNKDLYKIINAGNEITLNKEDIYDFKKCDDITNPQKESIYTAKVNTEGTDGYLDADSDLIMPFTFYSSSVGTDFSNFKDNLSITNLHDDNFVSLQSPFIRENVGGMPHRHVKIGTADDQRPEAFILSASSSKFVIKQPIGLKSIYSRGRNTFYNIRNIKTDTVNKVIGNYQKDYEIVLTNSRNLNNRSIARTGSLAITPKTADQILDIVDYKTPIRHRSEHIFVNRFSSPGGPETQAAYGRDKESEEYSIYNTINYRNLSIRQPLGLLEKEHSMQFGLRRKSSTQASIHMTNRNYFYYTGSDGDMSRPDNRNVQHPIPQNDFGYSWITSSATNTKFDFVNKNSGFGHQHNFSVPDIADNSYLKSKESILFATASILGSHTSVVGASSFGHSFGAALHPSFHTLGNFIPVDFVGLNTIVYEPIDLNSNSAGYDSLTWYNKPSTGLGLVQTNYINAAINDSHGDTTEDTVNPYGVAAVLNALIHHRQGPYGWPSWKQIRGEQHPITRAHRKSNTISRIFWGDSTAGTESIIRSSTTPSMNAGYQRNSLGSVYESVYERARRLDSNSSETNSRIIKNYKEIMVTNRFRPITITIHGHAAPRGQFSTSDFEFGRGMDPRMPDHFKTRESTKKLTQTMRENSWNLDSYYYESLSQPGALSELEMLSGNIDNPFIYFGHISYKESFQNDISCFANQELVKDIKFTERIDHKSLDFLTILIDENSNQEQKLIEINYIEKIYPREINTYTKEARERQNFNFWAWNSSREGRSIILKGNLAYKPETLLLTSTKSKAFPFFDASDRKDYKKSFYGSYDAIDVDNDNSTTLNVAAYITASTWPLDSRKDFALKPVNVNSSYFTSGPSYLATRDQGTRGEGILQNDFSTFAMGYNGLYGTPPFATVYNRRIPQTSGLYTYLAGEAKWEAADGNLGPFYDSYKEYAFDSIRLIAQDHSVIPEFRISEFTEEVLKGTRSYPDIGNDFLNLTGAVYHSSPTEISVDGQFFKTYSNSDFLKYFSVVQEEVVDENSLAATRLTLKCKAAMKFLPYKGFYPAERAIELSELFNRSYLETDDLSIRYRPNMPMSRSDARGYLKLRTKASKYSAEKCFTGPGVLFNSIKAGTAVDYPLFVTDYSQALTNMPSNYNIRKHATLQIPNTTSVTGSLINGTVDRGVPRLKGVVHKRIAFEDLLNPVNIHNTSVYDNEPHPSASLLYGNSFWNRVVERPSKFGGLNRPDLAQTLGLDVNNTLESFSKQMLPYTLAMQNFAAETVNFFLEDGHLATAVSKPIKQYFEKDTVNKMRVRLTNADTVMYDRHSAFGPPVDDTGAGVAFAKYTPNAAATNDFIELTFANPADNANFNLDSVSASGSMPALSLTDVGSDTTDYVFYSSVASGFNPVTHTTSTQKYIDVNVSSANDLATAFESAQSAAGPSTMSVTRTDAKITLTVYDAPGEDSETAAIYKNDFLSNVVLEPEAQFGGASAIGAASYTQSTVSTAHSHGYAPYVPPFLDPNSDPYVEITFKPTENKEYLAREIINSSSFEYHNFHTVPNNTATNTNYINAMSLSASLNLGMCVDLETDNSSLVLSGEGLLSDIENPTPITIDSRQRVDQNDILSRWVIQTKWETPILDFSNVTSSALNLTTDTVNFVTGSPWKTRYWDSYYTQSAGKSSVPYLTSSTGMWHQKGAKIPSFGAGSGKGYHLQVEDVLRDDGQPGLASTLGFNSVDNASRVKSLSKVSKHRRKLGIIENKKLLKEAIVAIPYVIDETSQNQVQFVNFDMLPGSYYPQAMDNLNKIKRELGLVSISSQISTLEEYKELLRKYEVKSQTYISDSPMNAIEYQLFMMEEYILPPQLDFLVTGNNPCMMYFFQFKASMNSTDLSNVWQNLYPSSSNSTAKPRYSYPNKEFEGRITPHNDVSYISHYLNTEKLNGAILSPVHNPHNLFSPIDSQNKTRWLVFKVKQRGLTNLEEVRMRSIDSRESNFQKPIDYIKESKTSLNQSSLPKDLPGLEDFAHSKLQFNWPYDYFSFVELVKLDAKVDLYNYIVE